MYQGLGIYRIYRTDKWSYDDYDEAIVVAENELAARQINPDGETKGIILEYAREDGTTYLGPYGPWTTLENIKAELVGIPVEGLEAGTVLCASFNAG